MKGLHSRCAQLLRQELPRLEALIQTRLARPVCGYEPAAVTRRLLQRWLERSWPAFLASEDKESALALLVRPPFVVIVRDSIEFIGRWARALADFVWGALRPGDRQDSAAALLYGVGPGDILRGGNDAAFVRFCLEGPITPLASVPRLIVEKSAPAASTSPGSVRYARRPLEALHGFSPRPNIREWAAFFRDHLGGLADFIRNLLRMPAVASIGRDFAESALAASLERRGLLSKVVTTNSYYYEQRLWMTDRGTDRERFHVVWYSGSIRPVRRKTDSPSVDLPHLACYQADVSWVWSEPLERCLREAGARGEFRRVGPVLWCLPSRVPPARDPGRVAVFDVTPFRPEHLQRHGYVSYYTADTMVAFLDGVAQACECAGAALGMRLRPVLKSKRSFSAPHDPRYITAVKELQARGAIEVAAADENLYDFISASDAVIVAPFSSPAHVAQACGRPVFYFDGAGQAAPSGDELPGVPLIASPTELAKALAATVGASRA